MMRIAKIRPSTVAVLVSVILLLNILIFAVPETAAQVLMATGGTLGFFQGTQIEGVFQIIGYIITLITFFTLIGAITFWAIKVKNYKMLEETIALIKQQNESLKLTNAELEAKVTRRDAQINRLEESEEKLRKANFRLQGIPENDE